MLIYGGECAEHAYNKLLYQESGCRDMHGRGKTIMYASRGKSMQEASLGAPIVSAPVGEHHRSTAYPKQAVGDEHGALIAEIPVLCDVLSAQHQAVLIGVHLHRWDTSYVRLYFYAISSSCLWFEAMLYHGIQPLVGSGSFPPHPKDTYVCFCFAGHSTADGVSVHVIDATALSVVQHQQEASIAAPAAAP